MKKVIIVIGLMLLVSNGIFYFKNKEVIENNNELEKMNRTSLYQNEEVRYICFQFDDKEIIVELENNTTTKDFIKNIPFSTTFEDYNHTEKIGYPPADLEYDNSGFDPEIGDLAYFSPWGNLAFYYKDSGYYPSLVKIGTIVSGIEYLKEIDGKVVIVTAIDI